MATLTLEASGFVASFSVPVMEASDRESMLRLARGDREALTPLVDRHYRRLFRITLAYLRDREDALDAVQETFIKVVEHAGSWRESSEVGPWLTRIAINHAIDRYRRSKRRGRVIEPLTETDHDLSLESGATPPDRKVLGRELGERVGAAVKSLPDTQRAVFVLRHYEEKSLDEIARTLGISLGTVKSSLHRALQRLRRRLEDLRS